MHALLVQGTKTRLQLVELIELHSIDLTMRTTFSATALAGLIASATAGPALKLTVIGPLNTTDVENLSVKATLTNTGTETLKLINDPRTVLSAWRTNTFSIQNEAGSPAFTGIKVK